MPQQAFFFCQNSSKIQKNETARKEAIAASVEQKQSAVPVTLATVSLIWNGLLTIDALLRRRKKEQES